jgi:uroporphyrinogen-III decarboxylase
MNGYLPMIAMDAKSLYPFQLPGNLDPLRLAAGGGALDEGVDAILDRIGGELFVSASDMGSGPRRR